MKLYSLAITASLAFVAIACGDNTTMMSDFTTVLDRHVEAVRVEQATHSKEIGTAEDVDAVARAETTHWQRNRDQANEMTVVIDDMRSCTDVRGNPLDHATFAGMMQSMRSECDQHRDTMLGLADSEKRQGEETRHQDAMQSWLDQMHGQIGTMANLRIAYHCQCSHCGM